MLRVTIGYAPFVEGTAIIYDLTDETMQGKARPFVCNLRQQLVRLYAVMPFQIEETALSIEGVGNNRHLHVAFLDARREAIQAALPFELRLIAADAMCSAPTVAPPTAGASFSCPPGITFHHSLWWRHEACYPSRLTGHEESLLLNPGKALLRQSRCRAHCVGRDQAQFNGKAVELPRRRASRQATCKCRLLPTPSILRRFLRFGTA